MSETPYLEGKRQGVMIKYYEDGSKSSETPYVDGNANGTEIKYRRNGSKEMETVRKNIGSNLRYGTEKMDPSGRKCPTRDMFSTALPFRTTRTVR